MHTHMYNVSLQYCYPGPPNYNLHATQFSRFHKHIDQLTTLHSETLSHLTKGWELVVMKFI